MLKQILDKLDDAIFLRLFHGVMTILWAGLIPVTVLSPLKTSITWIALMSVWANFVGHFSSWQASRAEVKIDKDTARLK